MSAWLYLIDRNLDWQIIDMLICQKLDFTFGLLYVCWHPGDPDMEYSFTEGNDQIDFASRFKINLTIQLTNY